MNKKPERVIPLAVLEKKKKAVPVMAAAGVLITALGAFKSLKGGVLRVPEH